MNGTQRMVWHWIRLSTWVWSISLVALTVAASAQTFRGTITDATTQKPAAGDEVALLDFSSGIQELARTQSDSNGSFAFEVGDSGQSRMLRVTHQGATYYKVAPLGATSVHLDVYDVSKKLTGIAVAADVTRFQATGDSLQGVRLFVVKNDSAPPQTQMSEHNFEFHLPEGAQIDNCMARSAGGQPVRTFPVPLKEKDSYAFVFPLRPGETQFQVLFHLPYKDAATIDPKPVYNVEHFVVMLPKKMQFTASRSAAFQPMTDPRQSDAIVQVASNTTVGQPLSFTLSGSGALAETKAEARGVSRGSTLKSGSTVREPQSSNFTAAVVAPDRAGKSSWYVLGGLGVLLAVGTVVMARRSTKPTASDSVCPEIRPNVARRGTPAPREENKPSLNELKEQLFQLEVGHKQKRIPQLEYEKAMAALQQSLERAMARKTVSAG